MPDNRTQIVRAQSEHLNTLKTWFPDKGTAYDWCGPGLRFPFTDETFLEDIHWERIPAYSLVSENKELIGFGQYYEKAGRCHLARLVISPAHRSRGLGYHFIDRLMEVAMKDLGLNECSLFVIRSNEKALKCYRALKFEKADYPPGHEYFDDIDFMVRKKQTRVVLEEGKKK
jgi:ribosomal protein S18 acetylase RimI-like enzyme